jgi:DNA-binding YbaB/EbfC family protein
VSEPDEPSFPDLGGLLEQVQGMQGQVVEGQAGGGVVKVEVTAGWEFRSITIAPEAVDPDDVEMLQDLVLAALRDAAARVAELQMGGLGKLLGGP